MAELEDELAAELEGAQLEDPAGDDAQPDAGAELDDVDQADDVDDDQGDDAGDDQGDDPAGESEGLDPDEEAVLAQASAEQTLKKVSSAADRYIKKLVELLGAELGGYAGCSACDGFPPGLVILEAIDDERRTAVSRQFGLTGSLDDYQADEPFFRQCSQCRGRGRVLTGSRVEGKQTIVCRVCHGDGFESEKPPAVVSIAGELIPVEVIESNGTGERPPYDIFGTPSWHADYGKMVDMREMPVAHWAANLPASTAS